MLVLRSQSTKKHAADQKTFHIWDCTCTLAIVLIRSNPCSHRAEIERHRSSPLLELLLHLVAWGWCWRDPSSNNVHTWPASLWNLPNRVSAVSKANKDSLAIEGRNALTSLNLRFLQRIQPIL